MKYLFAGLVISSVQIIFMIAFTLCALVIGASTLMDKLKPKKIPARVLGKTSREYPPEED